LFIYKEETARGDNVKNKRHNMHRPITMDKAQKSLFSPFSPLKRFEKVGIKTEYPLNILLIPLDHSDRETYMYRKMTQERLFPANSVVYLESRQTKIGDPKADIMKKGKDYVYERDIKGNYNGLTSVIQFLNIMKMYHASNLVENEKIKKRVDRQIINLTLIHGPDFMKQQYKDMREKLDKLKKKGTNEKILEKVEYGLYASAALRTVASEAAYALRMILYYTVDEGTEASKTYFVLDEVLNRIRELIGYKETAIKKKQKKQEKLKKEQISINKTVNTIALNAIQREDAENEINLKYLDIVQKHREGLNNLKKQYPEFKESKIWGNDTIPNEPWQILRIVEKLFNVMEDFESRAPDDLVEISYRVVANPRKEIESSWIIRTLLIYDKIHKIPGTILSLMKQWKMGKDTQEIEDLVTAVYRALNSFSKKISDLGTPLREMKGNMLNKEGELSNIKDTRRRILHSEKDAGTLITRAKEAKKYLKRISDMHGEKEGYIADLVLLSKAEYAPLQPNIENWRIDRKRKEIGNYTLKQLFESVENLCRVYVHVVARDEFANEFLNVKRVEERLKGIDQLEAPQTNSEYIQFKEDYYKLYGDTIETTLRDAVSLKAVLKLAENKFEDTGTPVYVFMAVGSAHVSRLVDLIKLNHNLLQVKLVEGKEGWSYQEGWYVETMMNEYNTIRKPEYYYKAIQKKIKAFEENALKERNKEKKLQTRIARQEERLKSMEERVKQDIEKLSQRRTIQTRKKGEVKKSKNKKTSETLNRSRARQRRIKEEENTKDEKKSESRIYQERFYKEHEEASGKGKEKEIQILFF